MLEMERIFLIRPEAAANPDRCAGYENLRGQVLFYPAPGGTIVVAQVEGLPGDGFFGIHLHQGDNCRTRQEPFDGAGAHWGLPGQLHPEHLGDLPVLLAKNGQGLERCVDPAGFSPVRPGATPSLCTGCRMIIAPNRRETLESASVVVSFGNQAAC